MPRAHLCSTSIGCNPPVWVLGQDLPVRAQAGSSPSVTVQCHCAQGCCNKTIQKLLEFFKEFRISGFKCCHGTVEQISMGSETESNFKDHCIQWKGHDFPMKLQTSQVLTTITKNLINLPYNGRLSDGIHKHF